MKRFITASILAGLLVFSANLASNAETAGQKVKQGLSNAGHTVATDTKKVGHAIASGTKKAGHKLRHPFTKKPKTNTTNP